MRESSVYGRPNTFKYTMFIDDQITAPSDYRDEFELLENVQEGDDIVININSGGGRLDTTLQFIALIENCKGNVIGRLTGQACSGAAMIFLSCHEQQLSSLSELMAHSASGGYGGKMSDLAAFAKHNESHINNIMNTVYQGFLTDDELNELHTGKEFWMNANEISDRLNKRIELFTKLDKEANEEADRLMNEMMFGEQLPETVLNKLTKSQLVSYIKGEIEVAVNEDGSYEIVEIEDES